MIKKPYLNEIMNKEIGAFKMNIGVRVVQHASTDFDQQHYDNL